MDAAEGVSEVGLGVEAVELDCLDDGNGAGEGFATRV
jgi:hypothetical protein